jgi:hypothetical protein
VKRIAIKVAGNDTDPIDTIIYPGTTAAEILAEHSLQGYLLSLPNSHKFFGNDEVIYPFVGDGDKLQAMTHLEVGIS